MNEMYSNVELARTENRCQRETVSIIREYCSLTMVALSKALFRTILTLLATQFYVTAHAASFDCNAANSTVEHLICNNSALSSLDEKMSELYTKQLYSSEDSDKVRSSQRTWLKNVRNRCATLDCLESAYVTRVKSLTTKTDEISQSDVCKSIAQHANNGTLSNLSVKPVAVYAEAEKLFFEPGSPMRDLSSLWKVPMGKTEGFVYIGEFHAQQIYPTLYVRAADQSGNILEIDERDFNSGSSKFLLIRIANTYYVLGIARVPTKLWGITDDLRLNEVCAFHPNPKPIIQLVKGTDDSVCKAIESGKGIYASFSGESHIYQLPIEPRFRGIAPIQGATLADIDNDGNEDRVVRLGFAIGNGRECDTYFLAITNKQGTAIPDNSVNRALRQTDECVASGKDNIGIFALNGTNYIDAKGWFGKRSIYLVTDDNLHTVCKFSGRTLTDVDATSGSYPGRTDGQ